MEYAIPIICVIIVLAVVFFVREIILNNKVLSNSKKISMLLELNKQTVFHKVTDVFEISKHYDNKSNYSKIEPAYIMTAEIRSNLDFYSDYVFKIKENRLHKEQYLKEAEAILSKEISIDYKAIGIPEKSYLKREEKLFKKRMIFPIVDCRFLVNLSYTSKKGRVNLSKGDAFNFDEFFTCFESVSRTYLKKGTYSQLAAVERGEISDSLRYDILKRDNFACAICGATSKLGARLHIDHIVPISKGGKSVPENLRTLCERCNVGKSDKIETVSSNSNLSNPNNDIICERCGSKMVLRKGKFGEFYGCRNYPKCNFTINI